MGKIGWYKRYPDRALNGMFRLTLEERGAYNTILDLIYSNDGQVIDEEKYLAGCMNCDVRVWRRLRQRLIDANKIYLRDGFIRNEAADREVGRALGRVLQATEAGVISARKRQARLSDNNDLASTDAQRTPQRYENENENEKESKKEEEGGGFFSNYPKNELAQFRKQCPSLTDREFEQELFKIDLWVKAHGRGQTPDLTLSRWLQKAEKEKPKTKPNNSDKLRAIDQARGLIPYDDQ